MSSHIRPYKNILPTIAASAYIDPAACVIGDVVIGEDSSVWPMVTIRGDVNVIEQMQADVARVQSLLKELEGKS